MSLDTENKTFRKVPDKNEISVFAFDLPSGKKCLREFESFLSNEEIERANRFHFSKDKNNFIVSHGILRLILSWYLNVKPTDIIFIFNKYGKPYLYNSKNIKFNISHSKNKLLMGFSNGIHVGIDIEFMNVVFAKGDIAKNYFSPDEVKKLKTLSAKNIVEGFYNCWTRKEAFIKGVGMGLSIPLDSFDVELLPGRQPTIIDVRFDESEKGKWELFNLDIYENYRSALAVREHNVKINLYKFDKCCEILTDT